MHLPELSEMNVERRYDWLAAGLLIALFVFSWKATRFYGVDTPLFLALGTFCLWRLGQSPVAITKPALKAYLLWAGWVIFSDFYSAQFAPAFARDSHWLLLPLFALLCAAILRDVPALVSLLRLTAAASVITIALHLIIAAPDVSNWIREPVFGHVRYLSMAVGALVIWLYDDEQLGKVARIVVSVARFTGLVILCWAGGRGVLLALAAAILVQITLFANARRRALVFVLEGILAAGVSELISVGHSPMGLVNSPMGLLNSLSRSVTAETADGLSSARLTLWSSTLKRLGDGMGLWFGWGGNGFIRMGLARGFIFHPHNVVLQILTDWGAVGLLLFANFLRVAIRPLTGLNLSTSNAALAISIIAYSLITGMIDGGLYHPQFLICVGIAFAILLAQLAKTDVKPSTLVISPVPMILVILVMLVTHLRMF
jgi:hypothetical protein